MDETLIEQARQKQSKARPGLSSDKLLEDVFPKHVAEALKAGKKVEAQHYDSVTIFFSDIVGQCKGVGWRCLWSLQAS